MDASRARTLKFAWACAAGLALGSPAPLATAQEDEASVPRVEAVRGLLSRIAFGSCSDQTRPQDTLRAALDAKPDLFVYLGDNIYGDTRNMDELRTKYAQLGGRPEFQALRAAVPLVATWDDHDYGENDAGKEYPFREESKRIFLDFWGEPPGSARRDRPGIYTSYLFQDSAALRRLQLILLDTRTFRDPVARNTVPSWKNDYHPDPDPSKTILGEAQWAWLRERLLEPADLRIIGTSIQFAHEYNGWESWTNFPSELLKMIGLIRETRANGVVFISGDVHWGELSILPVEGLYPLHDVTSSGLNQDWDSVEPNQNRFGDVVRDYNFGMLEIDWERTDPVLEMRIHDARGTARVAKQVALSELRMPGSP